MNGYRSRFSSRLINGLGAGLEFLDPSKFDTNTNSSQSDLFDSPRKSYVICHHSLLWSAVKAKVLFGKLSGSSSD